MLEHTARFMAGLRLQAAARKAFAGEKMNLV
jgi:hypothetical protein